ncbi:MAG: class I SAM-dependent methyltransferase [Flavobacteriales bacterium]|jgi:SAM-dependent methyltransferase|nr:class I SAM-dependent methyltransferase [Flavobacteriales bacterium]
MEDRDAFEANRQLWNARVPHHLASRMYDVDGFLAGKSSLTDIELDLLGDVTGKRILHLQCHFGQDTLSIARMGAEVTGLDISDAALEEARKLAARCGSKADWVLSNVVDHVRELDGEFEIVFTSYGTIGWLPDLKPWAANIKRYLKPGGRFVFVEFHPAVWMFDNDFTHVQYSYFNREVIVEQEQGTYADRDAPIKLASYGWNHDLGEVLTALINEGLVLERFMELDGSPHDSFTNTVRGSDGMYRVKGMEGKLPMVYGLTMRKA